MKSFEDLQETMDLLNELVTNQSKALTLSKEIIDGKSRIIEICEKQIVYYKKENRIFKICFYLLVAFTIITSLIKLL